MKQQQQLLVPKKRLNMYDIIYADPPWRYDSNTVPPNRRIENHYSTMELDEIKNMSIPASDNCILYLWSPAPLVLQALGVLSAWGFTYKAQMVWDKKKMGMGYWFRGQHEVLLVGVKGDVSAPPQGKRIRSVYRETRTHHSKKPDSIRRLIDEWYPDKSKLELFARATFMGWDVYGNEASTFKQTYLGNIREEASG